MDYAIELKKYRKKIKLLSLSDRVVRNFRYEIEVIFKYGKNYYIYEKKDDGIHVSVSIKETEKTKLQYINKDTRCLEKIKENIAECLATTVVTA